MSLNVATVAFYIIAILLVASALAVVFLRNIVHAALSLVAVFGAAAGIYLLLNAEFIAIVQVLIYAGAVTILIFFAIMLTQNSMSKNSNPFSGQWWLAGLIAALLGAGIVYAVGSSQMLAGTASTQLTLAGLGPETGTVVRLGQLLYSPFEYSYVLPFEIASVVLLVAMVGAIMIGRGEEE
ncbi:MAG: NADH-ubiquinone oxidoreductase chain J [Ktedonobacterales bacterium]|jgi:NADH-quinone oxidoreductase subunit J|nr:MAG: NADH-ubiquinone oxidoreductase chain J [Ktedonobacterales bacterium]